MKSLLDFKTIVEEEKSDYSKFDMLVRAGLANKAQIQRIHKILDKMQEERPVFNNADRMILQNMFNKMVDLISNNKQIFSQARRAVKEDVEAIEAETLNEETQDNPKDPPFVLLLKRKAIRVYPDKTKVALYHNKQLDKYFSVPYGPGVEGYVQAEETELEEAVDAISQLQKIKDSHSHGTVNHKDGTASKIDVQTAHAILTVHKNLNDDNKKKFSDMVARSSHHLKKAADFSWKQMK
jgi:hypothetical protein